MRGPVHDAIRDTCELGEIVNVHGASANCECKREGVVRVCDHTAGAPPTHETNGAGVVAGRTPASDGMWHGKWHRR